MLDDLLPVVVFETLEGLLLVDRYHRVAPRHLGLETVEADVRRGVAQRVVPRAAAVGAAERGISAEEAASYIELCSRGP